jgi:hypothetical protein
VDRWTARPVYHIVIPQDPEQPSKALPEERLSVEYPKTYTFFKHFEDTLRARSGYRKFFDPSKDPFYSIYNVGDYTFAPFKVVWREVATDIRAAVVDRVESGENITVPDHTLIVVPASSSSEAHFMCALLNSSPADYIIRGYVAGHPSTHVLKYIAIPQFDPTNSTHLELVICSQQAHAATIAEDTARVREVESEVDRLAARLWGLAEAELREIQESLAELG